MVSGEAPDAVLRAEFGDATLTLRLALMKVSRWWVRWSVVLW